MEKVSDMGNLSLTFFLRRVLVFEEFFNLDPRIFCFFFQV